MELRRRKVEVGIAAGLGAAMAGLVTLLLHMAVLTATQPGTSFPDNYGQGRLPWIPIAFGLMMVGLTVASLVGIVLVWLRGPALGRVGSVLPAAPIVFWWIWASLPPPGGAPCDPDACAPRVAGSDRAGVLAARGDGALPRCSNRGDPRCCSGRRPSSPEAHAG